MTGTIPQEGKQRFRNRGEGGICLWAQVRVRPWSVSSSLIVLLINTFPPRMTDVRIVQATKLLLSFSQEFVQQDFSSSAGRRCARTLRLRTRFCTASAKGHPADKLYTSQSNVWSVAESPIMSRVVLPTNASAGTFPCIVTTKILNESEAVLVSNTADGSLFQSFGISG